MQRLLREHADALAASIVLEQGKTIGGVPYLPGVAVVSDTDEFCLLDAHGDVLRGLQVVETACGAATALLGEKIEVSRDMDTETRRLPLGVCARLVPRQSHVPGANDEEQHCTFQLPCNDPSVVDTARYCDRQRIDSQTI